MDPINPCGQIFRRYRPAEYDLEMPAAFVNDTTGNQFRLVTDGQPHRAGGHSKSPAIANRHVHLFAGRIVNRHQQQIPRGEKFVRRPQLVQMKDRRNARKKRNLIFTPLQPGTGFRFSLDQDGSRKPRRPKPRSQQKVRAKMAEGQHDRTSVLPGLLQAIKSRHVTAVHPFGFCQPLGKIIQQVIHITIPPPLSDGANRLIRAETGRHLHDGRNAPERGAHKSVRFQNPVKAPNRQPSLCPADHGKEQQTLGVFEPVFHSTKTLKLVTPRIVEQSGAGLNCFVGKVRVPPPAQRCRWKLRQEFRSVCSWEFRLTAALPRQGQIKLRAKPSIY